MTIVLRSPIVRSGFNAGSVTATAFIGSQGGANGAIGYQRLPGEALYNVDLALQNIVMGSVVLITDLAGIEIARTTASGGTTTLSLPFYGANQTVKITVRKSTTAPFYQSFETQAVITSTGASVYINQLSDE